ncbi:MAG: glycoside hydrolase family protein [Muribaculaceae bacterium]|nr:glycoside hydrolase family protein [Muribaculaceae bacterium]MDE6523716.1 glycoside hydrolase family protein [Muribaculaceae bacterium]
MKKIQLLIILFIVGIAVGFAISESDAIKQKAPTFEDAIAIIKKYEGLSGPSHWPFVGYGHKVMPGEKFTRGKKLTEKEADALARADYAKLCAKYREFGADSLLLAALAYNCGPGVVAKSSVLSKLKAGNRDIEASYIAHSRYRGKQLSQLKRRRQEELAVLFVKDPTTLQETLPASDDGTEIIEEVTEITNLSAPEHTEQKKDSVKHVAQNAF